MKNRVTQFVLIFLCVRLAVGCATIIHGSDQDVAISSAPDEAEVWIDGARVGMTPTKVNLKRKNDYLVTVKKTGYKDASVKIQGETSAWIIGNVVFGGLIGCGIDFLSGGAYDLKPDRVDINLTNIAELDGKTIHVGQAQLEKIKQICFVDQSGRPKITVNISWAE